MEKLSCGFGVGWKISWCRMWLERSKRRTLFYWIMFVNLCGGSRWAGEVHEAVGWSFDLGSTNQRKLVTSFLARFLKQIETDNSCIFLLLAARDNRRVVHVELDRLKWVILQSKTLVLGRADRKLQGVVVSKLVRLFKARVYGNTKFRLIVDMRRFHHSSFEKGSCLTHDANCDVDMALVDFADAFCNLGVHQGESRATRLLLVSMTLQVSVGTHIRHCSRWQS